MHTAVVAERFLPATAEDARFSAAAWQGAAASAARKTCAMSRDSTTSPIFEPVHRSPCHQMKTARRRAREPGAPSQHRALVHGDTIVSPRGSSTKHDKAPPRKARVYCGQNRLDPSLRVNGGALEVGTRSKCFRSGFGAALHQQINDEETFAKKFTACRSSGTKTSRRPRGISLQRSVRRDSAASARGAPRWRASCARSTGCACPSRFKRVSNEQKESANAHLEAIPRHAAVARRCRDESLAGVGLAGHCCVEPRPRGRRCHLESNRGTCPHPRGVPPLRSLHAQAACQRFARPAAASTCHG